MSEGLKRFYKDVSVAAIDGAFAVHLDGRTLKTPGKKPLILRHRPHAQLVADEWAAQDTMIRPETMPCTRLANVACERLPDGRVDLIMEARNYADTDVLCYRSAEPEALAARQKELWDPVLAWAVDEFGIRLKTTDSLMAVEQDAKALDAVADYARSLDDIALTLYVHLVAVYGSAILAMAVMEAHLEGLVAFDLSRLDELWQIERWGDDVDAKARIEILARDIVALMQFLKVRT